MGWLRGVTSIKSQVSFAKEPYDRDYILQKRPIISSILLTVATPYRISGWMCLWAHDTTLTTPHHIYIYLHIYVYTHMLCLLIVSVTHIVSAYCVKCHTHIVSLCHNMWHNMYCVKCHTHIVSHIVTHIVSAYCIYCVTLDPHLLTTTHSSWHHTIYTYVYIYIYMYIHTYSVWLYIMWHLTHICSRQHTHDTTPPWTAQKCDLGWLRLVGSLKWQVSFAEYKSRL